MLHATWSLHRCVFAFENPLKAGERVHDAEGDSCEQESETCGYGKNGSSLSLAYVLGFYKRDYDQATENKVSGCVLSFNEQAGTWRSSLLPAEGLFWLHRLSREPAAILNLRVGATA